MDRLGRGRAPLLRSSPQLSGLVDLGFQEVTIPLLLAEEVEGEVEEERRWVIPAMRTESKENRKTLQDWEQAAEEGKLCGP